MIDMEHVDEVIAKYVTSSAHADPSAILNALRPICDVEHLLQPWVWRMVAVSAHTLGDEDCFLEYSHRFIFSEKTQRGDFRVGKLSMIIDRVEMLKARNTDYAAELVELQALSPSAFDLMKLAHLGITGLDTNVSTFKADRTIALTTPRDDRRRAVVAVNGRHFAAELISVVAPNIKIVDDVEVIRAGEDVAARKPNDCFYVELARTEAIRKARVDLSRDRDPIRLDGVCILLDDFFAAPNYCHWMLDWLPRLLLAQEKIGPVDYVLVREAKARFEIEALEMAGIGPAQIIYHPDASWYQCSRLVVVDNLDIANTHPAWGGNSEVIDLLRRRIGRPAKARGQGQRLYISRRDVGSRTVLNQAEVDEILQEFDFSTVDLTGMSVRQQADLFADCSLLLGVHGAGLTNMIFMPPEGAVFELFHYKYGSRAYSTLSRGCGHRYVYMSCDDVSGSTAPIDTPAAQNTNRFLHSNIWVEAAILRRGLESLCGAD